MEYNHLLLILLKIVILFWDQVGIIQAIIGGEEATVDQFKYQISLQRDNVHICGGAIISKSHILTAAHCVMNERGESGQFENANFSIIAGSIDLQRKTRKQIEIDVDKFYIPADYKVVYNNPINKIVYASSDIAVLKLNKKLYLHKNSPMNNLKLPEISSTESTYENETPIISGFGCNDVFCNSETDSGAIYRKDEKLMYGKTQVIPNSKCRFFPLESTDLCAIMNHSNNLDNKEGVSFGDSGGPLVIKGDIVIGVLADGFYRELYQPAVYTRVTSFLTFIKKAMNDENSSKIRVARYKIQKTKVGLFYKKTKYLVEDEID